METVHKDICVGLKTEDIYRGEHLASVLEATFNREELIVSGKKRESQAIFAQIPSEAEAHRE